MLGGGVIYFNQNSEKLIDLQVSMKNESYPNFKQELKILKLGKFFIHRTSISILIKCYIPASQKLSHQLFEKEKAVDL